MDDAEATKQIQQMVNFILNEAKETATTITNKANEDFNIEKLKLVQSMKEKCRTEVQKKIKTVSTKRAIERSTAINRARIKKIEARQQCIERATGDVASKLQEVTRSDVGYKAILMDLMVQGALKLMEEEVTIRCRKADANVVKGLLDQAGAGFSKVVSNSCGVKKSCRMTLDSTSLPANCLGGVIVCCNGGSITVDNTLDTRLKLVMQNDRPQLRKMLFPRR